MKEFICINCPLGCHLEVDDSDKNNIIVTGFSCERGRKYGVEEVTSPKRMVTTSVKVLNGSLDVCPIKTKVAIPKELIFDSLNLVKDLEIEAPIHIGDEVVKDILGTKIPFVATKEIERK